MMVALHGESIARFGGVPGIRDEALLTAALSLRASQNEGPVPVLAAAYGYGLARNHPFTDGNKRAAILAIAVFCRLNGYRFAPGQEDEVRTILTLAAGDLSEQQLADWVTRNSVAS